MVVYQNLIQGIRGGQGEFNLKWLVSVIHTVIITYSQVQRCAYPSSLSTVPVPQLHTARWAAQHSLQLRRGPSNALRSLHRACGISSGWQPGATEPFLPLGADSGQVLLSLRALPPLENIRIYSLLSVSLLGCLKTPAQFSIFPPSSLSGWSPFYV